MLPPWEDRMNWCIDAFGWLVCEKGGGLVEHISTAYFDLTRLISVAASEP